MARSRKTIRKFHDRKNNYKNPYTSIYGDPIAESHRLGYCHHKSHIGYLNHKLIVEHGCLKKQCPYFHKYEEHPYWTDRLNRRGDKNNVTEKD